jgi:hypothetical protein
MLLLPRNRRKKPEHRGIGAAAAATRVCGGERWLRRREAQATL